VLTKINSHSQALSTDQKNLISLLREIASHPRQQLDRRISKSRPSERRRSKQQQGKLPR